MQKQNTRLQKNALARAKKTVAQRAKTTNQPKKGLVHHTKRIIKLTPMFVHGMVAGAFVGVMVLVSIGNTGNASALAINSPRDCDSNAVISCGALTTTELKQRYYDKNLKGVAAIYNYFSISAADIDAMDETAAAGRVYKDGRVTIDGVVVATNARTAGRENIKGSTKVTSGGATFYTRPPSVSFNPQYINAFVVMKDGQFKFAILGACANPVSAKPIPKKTPPVSVPKEVPPVATVTPPSTQTPPSTPHPKVTVASTPTKVTELPKTGPGGFIMVISLAVIGGYLFHTTHRHVKHRRRTRHLS